MIRVSAEEFKAKGRDFLWRQGIVALRPYGREVGVAEPTTKAKGILIEEIIAILAGEAEPTPRSVRGAPIKDNFVDPTICSYMDDLCDAYPFDGSDIRAQLKFLSQHPRRFYLEDRVTNEKILRSLNKAAGVVGPRDVCKGQFQWMSKLPVLLPLDLSVYERQILIADETLKSYNLREGDIVQCFCEDTEKALVATKLLTINGLDAETIARPDFEELTAYYSEERIGFLTEEGPTSISDKYFEWVFPIYKGQRALIISSPKAGKTTLLLEMAKGIKKANKKMRVLALLVDQSPEDIAKFRKEFERDDLVYTTYDKEPETQVFSAEFLLNRAKRLAEVGENVCILIDSFNALAHAYNYTDLSTGGKKLAGGMESKTIQYLKKYLGTARCLEQGGSITIIGTLSTETGDPSDDILAMELGGVSNYKLYLNEELARNRTYPAIDLKKSIERFMNVENSLLEVALPVINKHGNTALLNSLAESPTYEEAYKKIERMKE